MSSNIENTKPYREFFLEVKDKIKSSQLKALRAVNTELISLYWMIGEAIVKKQGEQGWGRAVIEILAKELQLEFPGTKGFSDRNLWRMRNFYLTYKDDEKLPQLVAEIGWSHNMIILEKCNDNLERQYYIQMTRNSGWSRSTLVQSVKNQSYEKFLINQTNFKNTLPEDMHKRASVAVKDDYSFDFLELGEEHSEKELERGLVNNVRKFLKEMGEYFTFVGTQYKVEVDDNEYFIDLVLFHRQLRCLIALEFKKTSFKPEYAGKMQFYLSALDDNARLKGENPSIGIIICQEKSRTLVEYTLRDVNKPMGVSTYTTEGSLPQNLEGLLPSPEEIAKCLKVFDDDMSKENH